MNALLSHLPEWARAPVLVALISVAFLVYVLVIVRGSLALRAWLVARRQPIRLRQAELISAATLARWALRVLALVKLLLLVVGAYAALVAILVAVGASRTVFDLVTQPLLRAAQAAVESFVVFIPNGLMFVVVLVVTRALVALVRGFFHPAGPHHVFLPRLDPSLVRPTERLATMAVWVLGVIMAAPYLPGAGSKAFQGVTIFLGVIVSLGSSTLVGNLLAGLQLTYSRAYREGDRVQLGEVYGDVVELGTFATKVRTIQKEELTIPNALVQTWPVVNFTRGMNVGTEVHSEVTIGYDAPWRKVHELLLAAARATPGIDPACEPYVLQRALDDFFARYRVYARIVDPARHHVTLSELNGNIQDAFARANVEICSPSYMAIRDGNALAIPREHHPAGYQKPAFRVETTE